MSMVGRRPAPRPRRGGPIPGPAPDICGKFQLFGARRREPTPPDGRWRESDRLVLHRNLSYHSIHATPGGVRRGGGCRNPRSIAKKWNALPHLAPLGPGDRRGEQPRRSTARSTARCRRRAARPAGLPSMLNHRALVRPPKGAQKVTFGEFPASCRVRISTLQRTSRPPFVRSGHPDGGVPRRVSAISPTSSARPRSREHGSPRQRARSPKSCKPCSNRAGFEQGFLGGPPPMAILLPRVGAAEPVGRPGSPLCSTIVGCSLSRPQRGGPSAPPPRGGPFSRKR